MPGPLSHGHVLHLQRTAGNRAIATLLPSEEHYRVQRLLERGSNTGWGFFGWADNKAELLWGHLDQKFNTKLPALDAELASLAAANPYAEAQITQARALIARTVADHDGVIQRSKADALHATLNDVIATAERTQSEVTDERRKSLENLRTRLTALGQSGVMDSTRADRRKRLLGELSPIQGRAERIFDRTSWFKTVRQIESDFRQARQKQDEDRLAKREAEAEKRLQQGLAESERTRQDAVLKSVRTKLKNPTRALVLCGGDIDLLQKLVERMGLGEDHALESCLRAADTPEDVLRLLTVHGTSVKDAWSLLDTWHGDGFRLLWRLVGVVHKQDDEHLVTFIGNSEPHERVLLEPLLRKIDVRTLNRLHLQGTVTALHGLFVDRDVDAAETRMLLASSCGDATILLLSNVPDARLINQLRALEPDRPRLTALVRDLPHEAGAVTAVRRLLTGNGAATLGDVTALAQVQDARGLRTNAGILIPMVDLTTLPDPELTAVRASLDHIDGGPRPELTHPQGAVFGATFDNDEGRVPGVRGAGGYSEYYVEKDPTSPTYHGERRLVVNTRTGHVYYTVNHYQSFRRIR